MSNFDEVYDRMNKQYSALESLMSDVYSKEGNSDMIMSLGNVAHSMLETQISFTESFCQDNMRDALLSTLSSKEEALLSALNKGKNK